jgi:hypothetical protein
MRRQQRYHPTRIPAVVVCLRHDPRTRARVERRFPKDLSKMEIIRCRRACLAREVYRALRAGLQDLTNARRSAGASPYVVYGCSWE